MADTWNEVGELGVRLQSGLDTGYLYGNSTNQVGIVISAIPTYNGDPVLIKQEEFESSITLVDYVTGKELNPDDGWTYGTVANNFHGAAPARLVEGANINGLYQAIRYITCSPDAALRTRSIAVEIKPTSGVAVSSAQGGQVDSRVVLTAYDQISYSFLNNNVRTFTQVVPRADGQQQINYYLSAASTADGLDHYILQATVSVLGAKSPFFVWTTGVPDKKVARAWLPGDQQTSTSTPKVAYNQRPREVCITLLKGNFTYDGGPIDGTVDIQIYDQYGNTGTFRARPNNTPDKWEYGDAIEFVDVAP